ncbi:MAG: sugar phosphate isomerase/epimerase, partial [Acidobacteriota bacterium]|nr:sugar phosphate isomerase/epimerase [Acidobacteriota bacterium]
MPLKIAAFPKCYLETISNGGMSVFEWIEMAKLLDADGLEMYPGFLKSFDGAYLDGVGEAIAKAGFAMPMLCCSPDLTAPDPETRKREIEREAGMIAITRRLGGPHAVCRILSGQRYPEVEWEQGKDWVIHAIHELLPVAREHDVVLGMENHYKDGFWQYPEFAQKMDRFVAIVNEIEDRKFFGVQY